MFRSFLCNSYPSPFALMLGREAWFPPPFFLWQNGISFTIYDAAFLALAIRMNLALATRDAETRQASQAERITLREA